MTPAVVMQLRRVKQLHFSQAELEQRRRQAALDAAAAAVEEARLTLDGWQAEMPRLQQAIYDAVLGQVVGRMALDAVKDKVIRLREQERVLQQRLSDAAVAGAAARQAVVAATAAATLARRGVTKFDELIATLRRGAILAAERREEAELEEVAEMLHRPAEPDEEYGDADAATG